MGQNVIPDGLKQVNKKGNTALLHNVVACVPKRCGITFGVNTARSSETLHTINDHIPKPQMMFIIRQHCRSQQEN